MYGDMKNCNLVNVVSWLGSLDQEEAGSSF